MTTKQYADTPILIDLPMPITTPRLCLRPVREGDGPALYEAKEETWDALRKWMPWTRKRDTAEETEMRAREHYAKFIRRENIQLLGETRENNKLVLCAGLHRFNWHERLFEIGYWVRQNAQGNGYATEATNALLRYAFNKLKANRVSIEHVEGNDASRAVIRKLGFTHEGVLQNGAVLGDDTVTDMHVYGRTNLDNLPDLTVQWGPT